MLAALDHPEMVGVNPEVGHEQMAGLNFYHVVAQAIEAGKLFHIDLNDQAPGRYDQDFRFGSVNLKGNFFLVKFLEDVGYQGSRHFDAHAYRTENYEGVKDFARGCMRTYLILKDKAARWNADKEIQGLLKEINRAPRNLPKTGKYSKYNAHALLRHVIDLVAQARDPPDPAADQGPIQGFEPVPVRVVGPGHLEAIREADGSGCHRRLPRRHAILPGVIDARSRPPSPSGRET